MRTSALRFLVSLWIQCKKKNKTTKPYRLHQKTELRHWLYRWRFHVRNRLVSALHTHSTHCLIFIKKTNCAHSVFTLRWQHCINWHVRNKRSKQNEKNEILSSTQHSTHSKQNVANQNKNAVRKKTRKNGLVILKALSLQQHSAHHTIFVLSIRVRAKEKFVFLLCKQCLCEFQLEIFKFFKVFQSFCREF